MVIQSNVVRITVNHSVNLDLSKEELIPLKIHSHKGHYGDRLPKHMLSSDDTSYLSSNAVDWIHFEISDNHYYYPTKIKIRTINSGGRFRLKMGNADTNSWDELNEELFSVKRVSGWQTFNLDIVGKNDASRRA